MRCSLSRYVWHVPGTRHSVDGWFISFDCGKRLKDSHKHCHKQVQYQRVYPFTNSAYSRVSLKRLTNSFCSPGRKATKVWSRWLIFALLLFLGTLLLWSHFLFLESLSHFHFHWVFESSFYFWSHFHFRWVFESYKIFTFIVCGMNWLRIIKGVRRGILIFLTLPISRASCAFSILPFRYLNSGCCKNE
jgi:hypothetical protein